MIANSRTFPLFLNLKYSLIKYMWVGSQQPHNYCDQNGLSTYPELLSDFCLATNNSDVRTLIHIVSDTLFVACIVSVTPQDLWVHVDR